MRRDGYANFPWFNRCTLCTVRPRTVRVNLARWLAEDTDLATVEFGRGGSRKVLPWSTLCDGCSQDTVKAKGAALETPEGAAALESVGTLTVTLDWAGIARSVYGLRD